MFETVIVSIVKYYVARYFDLNTDQLSTQLLYKQQISIENLILNEKTLNDDLQKKFKLPIKIQSLNIKKIQCSFILSSLFFRSSSPALIIKVEGIHGIIMSTTMNDDESLWQTSTENEPLEKQHQLNLFEQQLEKEFECFGEVKSSRWNVQRLLKSFLEKVQIDIIDIHIRYQSPTSYTIGFTCQSIHIFNKSSDESLSQQILQMINPGLYIDEDDSLIHSYIISPITSIEIVLTHNHFLIHQNQYRYELECSLEDLTMKCTVEQVRILANMIHSVQQSSLRHMLLSNSNRPQSKISKQSAKAWWYYIVRTILRMRTTSSSQFWFNRTRFIHCLHQLIRYQQLYRLYLGNKYFQSVDFSSQDVLTMNELERDFHIKYILIIRRLIFQKWINENQSLQKKQIKKWYSTYARWITSKVIEFLRKIPTAENMNTNLNENDLKVQEQVNHFIAESLEDDDRFETCQNALIIRFKFALKSIEIDLLSSNNEITLFRFYLKNLSGLTEFRLRHRSIFISITLTDLYIRDQQQQMDEFANIISSKESSQQMPIIEFILEKKSKSRNSKQSIYTINIRSCGFCFVCSPLTMDRLRHLYSLIFDSSTQSLFLSFHNWKEIKNYTTRQVTSIWERIIPTSTASCRYHEKKIYEIHMNIGAPKIIIPLSSNDALIIDLGSVILSNDRTQQQQIENEEDEFLTPNSSPLTNDILMEEETTFYSINPIPDDIQYSFFSLSIHDIQVGYSIDHSQIVETFNVHFRLQSSLDHFWQLTHISGSIPKLNLHLSSHLIQNLIHSIQSWIVFGNNLIIQHRSSSTVCPQLNFCLDEIIIKINDTTQFPCDIRLRNVNLLSLNDSPVSKIILTLSSLTISDLLLKTNSHFIDLTANFSYEEHQLIVDVDVNKLHFIFNPKLVCGLMNLFLDIKSISSGKSKHLHWNIKNTFRELHLSIVDIPSMLISMELHLQNLALTILTDPSFIFEITMMDLEIVNLLTLDQKLSQHAALYLSLKEISNNMRQLSLKMPSISIRPSLAIINTTQQFINYMRENCHWIRKSQIRFIDFMLNLDLERVTIIFPMNVALQLSPIHISSNLMQTSDYAISIDRMMMINNVSCHTIWPLLENIILSLNLQLSNSILNIHSEMRAPLRIYLSKYRIKILKQILDTSSINTNSSLPSFIFHSRSNLMNLILQTDQLSTICEATLNHCQMTFESQHLHLNKINLHLDSLQINQSLLTLTSIKLITDQHGQININLNKINIEFIQSTLFILSNIMNILTSAGLLERKNKRKPISVNIDTIACYFRNDRMIFMRIDIQHLTTQIISSTIQSQLNFISIHDLTTTNQLYNERFNTKSLTFIFTRKLSHDIERSVRFQIDLHLTLIQYIHTQDFLYNLIDYFNHCQLFTATPITSQIDQRLQEIRLNIQLENMTLLLPVQISQTSVLVFQFNRIDLQNQFNHFISIGIKHLECYSSSLNNISNRNLSSMITRQSFDINIIIERNFIQLTSPIYIIKMNLSSFDLYFHLNHYYLIKNILIYNLNKLSNSLITMKNKISIEFNCIIQIENVSLEIFMIEHHQSIGRAILTNMYLSFNQYINGNQVIHILSSTVKLIDTRTQQEHMIIPLSIDSNQPQLKIDLSKTKEDPIQCMITMNSMRILMIIDWLLAFNEFLYLFCHESNINQINLSIISWNIQFNFNRFELILVSSTQNPYSSALIYSSTMMINYGKSYSLLECHASDFSFSTCQIGNIDETIVPMIEPTDCYITIQSSSILSNKQVCHLNIPTLNMRLSYSDIQMLYTLIYTITKQITEVKIRKPLLTLFSSILTSPIQIHQSSDFRFLNIQCLKLVADEMCLCFIDDCSGMNIPLLNIHLKPFLLETIEYTTKNRTDQAEFDLSISYYNRFQSGFEPLIEQSSLKLTLTPSSSSILLFISSNEIFNLNFTKAFYRLISTVKTNWLDNYNNNTKKMDGFRSVKRLDPYCFQNLLGVQIKFRTWLIGEQQFSSLENIVNDNQIVSFTFPTHSSRLNTQQRSNSLVASLFQSDRRLLIYIDGWEPLQPISIDRVGTFFRLVKPSHNDSMHKPILIMIDIAMTDNTIRFITIRSSIEIRNRLRTSIDLRLISGVDLVNEFCLEPKEIRSLPLQLCSTLRDLQIRPANFALDYCDESIHWSDIDKNSLLKEKTEIRQSFLRSCSINGKDAVYYTCLQSKQTCLLTHDNQSFSCYQLTILPLLTICNLLPCTLTFEILSHPQKFELLAYQTHREHTVNIGESLNITFATDIYRMNKPLQIQTNNTYCQQVIFYDLNQRELLVNLTIEYSIEYRLKIFVSVPYILLNKSGIPLIFKDTNCKAEAAGQSTDDEIIVNRQPLLFSFANQHRNKCLMRVGTGLHRHQDGQSQWSQAFTTEHESTHQTLQVRSSGRSTPHWYYDIAIDIRPGEGQLKKIHFIFFSARYIICNQCSYDLLIAQRSLKEDKSSYLHVSKQATISYYWPRNDMEKFLCIRAIDDRQFEFVHWSGSFSVDNSKISHINIRYIDGQCLILRVQVIKKNKTYFIVFMDSNQMLPPFRITNRSNVPILFYQSEIREESMHLRTIIQGQQSMDYVWDEPTLKPLITCVTPDGTKNTYDPLKLGDGEDLNYQNYIYLAFQDTFPDESLIQFSSDMKKSLVIEYSNKRLILARQQKNRRSQLWQMTNNGLLIHVESSPSSQSSTRNTLVLDIEDSKETNPRGLSGRFNNLTVRRYDSKRSLTQTWQWLENGYLCLANNTHLCVQVFGELKENNDLVLGSILNNQNQVPLATMHIRSHPQYDGSGLLSVRVIADGPISVLEIDNKKDKNSLIRPAILSHSSKVYHLDLHFPAGIGISMVGSIGRESEELLYVFLNNLHLEYDDKDHEQSIDARIETLTISNQLLTTTKPCFIYGTYTEDSPVPSAIRLQINWQKFNNSFTLPHIIHSFYLYINSITVQLEEILLWKLIDFFDIKISLSSLLCNAIGIKGRGNNTDRWIDLNVKDYETERILSLLTSTQATQIYFHKLYLSMINLNLSISCIPSKRSLPPNLQAIRRHASLPLVSFENAQITLKSYEQTHIFNTYNFLLSSILTHYINVSKRQAYKIVGTVDYLGNPLGLIHDVTDGFSCLGDERGVTGLVKSVTHGVADSTSKVTGSLSNSIGKLVSDRDRRPSPIEPTRSPTLRRALQNGSGRLAAGIYDGLTGVIKKPYKGVVEDGVSGLVKGIGKGIVGTVSKPMVGILDFTNEMATAIKEGARSPNTLRENRSRLPRSPCNTFGLLQPYSHFDAQGHSLLYKMNKGNSTERYITRFTLSTLNHSRHINAMITTERLILYQTIDSDPDQLEIRNSYDFHTPIVFTPNEYPDGSVSIKISFHSNSSTYLCTTADQASLLIREVQRAQDLFEGEKLIYINSSEDQFDDFDE